MSYQTIEQALAEALSAHDVTGVTIRADGHLHRFDAPGKRPGNKNGWYVCRPTQEAVFGFWDRSPEKANVSINAHRHPKAAQAARRATERAIEKHRREKAIKANQAARKAWEIWRHSRKPFRRHQYLVNKGVSPNRARQHGPALVLDIRGFDREIYSLQFIQPDGSKTLLSNGTKKGNFIIVGGPGDPSQVLICEGWATGCTLLEARPHALVLAAIDAGNLKPVAMGAQERWPDAELVVCGDDDRGTSGNPGRRAAEKAARAAGGAVAFPQWPEGAPQSLSDFNDLANWQKGNA